MALSRPSRFSASQRAAVRRSCQTIARWTGFPVRRSHTTVVSRWFVIPIAATRLGASFAFFSAARAHASWVRRISKASCSTQPGCGKCWRNSFCAEARAVPRSSNTMARELVVPWSSASTYFIRAAPLTGVERAILAPHLRYSGGLTAINARRQALQNNPSFESSVEKTSVKIHEYQAKEILRKYGVATPRGVACFSVDEAAKATRDL